MAAADVEFRCFVGGLAWATSDRSLEEAFSQYGEIIDSKIIMTRETEDSTRLRVRHIKEESITT
ncbi:hypothetical protein CTI12_AA224980 [Artemisia annua]|uniref:RRM domain-containing protein n=1 Tax=Artemisia annua TaxID=35608 RepID=A0A2U1MEM2_ARTAN|nr:hypothetical protein CTI12_AA224980 [Artemisia annua]